MSKETLEYHTTSSQAYVTKRNNAIKGTESKANPSRDRQGLVREEPACSTMPPALQSSAFLELDEAERRGSKLPAVWRRRSTKTRRLEKFKTDFAAAGVGQFGSGWCWLQVKGASSKSPRRRTARAAGPWRHPDPGLRRLGALYYIDYATAVPTI